jgi:alcohol dehydrogenase (cytochrome c)
MRKQAIWFMGAASVLAALGAAAAPAPGRQAGPFTREQVEAGRQAYNENCALCHLPDLAGSNDAMPLAGRSFINAWRERTTQQLFSKIHTSMPPGMGGSLPVGTYASIVAYILHANGAAAGTTPFAPDTAAVPIGSVATGTIPNDVTNPPARAAAGPTTPGQAAALPAPAPGGPAAQTQGVAEAARPAGPPVATSAGFAQAGQVVRYPDPGRFRLPTTTGLSLKGDIKNYVPVTDEMLRNPPPGDWLMFRGNYEGWSYSPLNQINASNVGDLQLKWVWAMPENGTMQITPLIHGGVMYMWGTGNTIQALDAEKGELLWENRLGPPPRAPGPGPSNEETRAMGLYGNNLYVNTPQGWVYALDARTGEEIWKTKIHDDPNLGWSTGGLMIIKGKVIVGMTNCGRRGDNNHCYISAYDTQTGKQLWRFRTVALTGEPGGDTWGKLPDNERKGAETWIAGTYDPTLNTTYWGTAQAKPWRRDERGSGDGDTEYANATLALDPDTGKLKWHFNHQPGETFDLDEVFERVLIDHGDQKHLYTIGKVGILWKLDRVTGKYLGSTETVFQNVYTKVDPVTGRPTYRPDVVAQTSLDWLSSCPGPQGGKNWQPMSYHKPTDVLIIPLSQSCVLMQGNGSQVYYEAPGTNGNLGRLAAYRASDMKPLWSFQQRASFLSGVTSTAGNVAFVGDFDRVFKAVDVANGKELWRARLGTTVQGFPVTFTANGKQYVAVTSALGGGSPQLKPGTLLREVHRPPNGYAVYVFGLPD